MRAAAQLPGRMAAEAHAQASPKSSSTSRAPLARARPRVYAPCLWLPLPSHCLPVRVRAPPLPLLLCTGHTQRPPSYCSWPCPLPPSLIAAVCLRPRACSHTVAPPCACTCRVCSVAYCPLFSAVCRSRAQVAPLIRRPPAHTVPTGTGMPPPCVVHRTLRSCLYRLNTSQETCDCQYTTKEVRSWVYAAAENERCCKQLHQHSHRVNEEKRREERNANLSGQGLLP